MGELVCAECDCPVSKDGQHATIAGERACWTRLVQEMNLKEDRLTASVTQLRRAVFRWVETSKSLAWELDEAKALAYALRGQRDVLGAELARAREDLAVVRLALRAGNWATALARVDSALPEGGAAPGVTRG